MPVPLGPPIPIGREQIEHIGPEPQNGWDDAPAPPGTIDLGARQRVVLAQLQQDQRRLAALNQERDTVIARINASRGKLELIAELTEAIQAIVTQGEEPA